MKYYGHYEVVGVRSGKELVSYRIFHYIALVLFTLLCGIGLYFFGRHIIGDNLDTFGSIVTIFLSIIVLKAVVDCAFDIYQKSKYIKKWFEFPPL